MSEIRGTGQIILRPQMPFRPREHCVVLREGVRDLRDFTLLTTGRDGIALSWAMMAAHGFRIGEEVEVIIRRAVPAPRQGEEALPSSASAPTGEGADPPPAPSPAPRKRGRPRKVRPGEDGGAE